MSTSKILSDAVVAGLTSESSVRRYRLSRSVDVDLRLVPSDLGALRLFDGRLCDLLQASLGAAIYYQTPPLALPILPAESCYGVLRFTFGRPLSEATADMDDQEVVGRLLAGLRKISRGL